MKRIYQILPLLVLMACGKGDSSSMQEGSSTGTGGSMARFTLSADHLYTVTPSHLTAYNVSNAGNPVQQKKTNIGFGVETIFPYKNNLFIGTEFGMQIMDITNPENPTFLSQYSHIRSCDPVVANEKYAFVTLRNGTTCARGINALDVIDISNLKLPKLVKSYPLTQPYGLALDGNNLFVCDGGVKHFDATNVLDIKQKSKIIIEATDVIANNGLLIIVGKDGIYQYDYSSGNLVFVSKIPTS